MREIEVKFEVDGFEEIRERLKKLKAKLIWEGNEENFYFDFTDRQLRRGGKMLRLREWKGHSVSVTLKEKILNTSDRYKIRNELELEAPDMKTAKAFLGALGLQKTKSYTKYRWHWAVGNAYVELDSLGGRYFVEIEGTKKKIQHLAKRLGLDWNRATTESYITLIDRMG